MASAKRLSSNFYSEDGSAQRLESLLHNSTLIKKGPPGKRLLKTVRENIDQSNKIRRWTFGVRNPSKNIRTILMVGETGTGKSTLINMMVNYVLGVEWRDNVLFEIIEEEKRSQAQSQTASITVYEIFGMEGVRVPFSLRLIDTPGYGDTKGHETDKLSTEYLLQLFKSENGVHQIDAVCFVVKASQNRLTPTQKYIFDSVLSLFGKDLKNNIMALITFSDGGKPEALLAIDEAGVPCARNKKNQPVHFKFNNVSEIHYDGDGDGSDDDDGDTKEDFMKRNWDMGKKSMKAFFTRLDTMEMKSTKMSLEVLRKRISLEGSIELLQQEIKKTEYEQKMLTQTWDALKKHKEDMDADRDFEFEVEKSFKKKVESAEKALNCTVCKTTCHHPCTIMSSFMSYLCDEINVKYCESCPKKCRYKKHVKEQERYKIYTRKVTKTYKELKEQYEKAAGEKMTAEELMKALQKDINISKEQKTDLIEDSYQCVVKLEEMALRSESLSTLKHLDFMIACFKESRQTERVQKLEKMKKSAEEANKIEEENPSIIGKIKHFVTHFK